MPGKETLEGARWDEAEGKSPSKQAGEFVREEIHHVREGKHGARSAKQAIAIGLTKAQRAGLKLPAPKKGKAPAEVRRKAQRDIEIGQEGAKGHPPPKRSRSTLQALKREGSAAGSEENLSRQARRTARTRGAAASHQASVKAVRTKGEAGLEEAAQKTARTRSTRRRAA